MRKNRQGLTLMEVLLVLAIMAIASALVWPALQKPLAVHRLHTAADEVRSEWCRARVEAMRSGHTYAFRYEVGGDRYYSEPNNATETIASESVPPAASALGHGFAADPSTNDAALPLENKTLPKGVKFFGQNAGESLAAVPAQDLSSGAWSDPIFFYPDGTASDVQLVLTCNQSCTLRVNLRGSTATATIADAGATVE